MPDGSRRSSLLSHLTVLSVLSVVAGCASDTPDASSTSGPRVEDAGSFEALRSDLLARVEAPDRSAEWYRLIEELLPNTVYAPPGESPAPLTDCVVSGNVSEVERGHGNKPGKRDTWVQTTFDDPKAWTRTVLVSLAVEDQLGAASCAASDTTSSVQFGLALGPELSFDDAADGLRAMDTIVVFLARSPVFADEPTPYGVVLDGGMIADVNEVDGTLSLPFVSADRARSLLATSPSLDDLRAAGLEGESTIALRLQGEGLVR